MCRKLVYLVCVSLFAAGAAHAAVFSDNFDTPHDFLADGVAGTSWDGVVGAGASQTASALNASTARAGQLFLESTGAFWHEPWNPLGPFLYKVIEGDFVATVRVAEYAGTAAAPVYHNTAGLMARALLEDAGAGEDWVSLDYFPIWNCGNFIRSANNNVRTENGHNGMAFNLRPWLQIERQGNQFHFRTSTDGITWTAMAQSPLTRDDLADVPLQVGVFQGTYNTTSGFAAFDDFKVEGPLVVPGLKAYAPTPADKATDVLRDVVLSWTPSEGAVSHNVYFGTSAEPEAVATAQDANSYDAGVLEFGVTYSWRVDDVTADGAINRGDLWSFTVEPFAYPIANVKATASSQHNADMGAGKTLDRSGLDADDLHGTDPKTMWLSSATGPKPVWIQYEFDRIYKVDQLLVWNSNQTMEVDMGLGAKDVTISYSTDGATWVDLGNFEFAQASGELLSPETVSLGGVVAKYVKLTIDTNWGGVFPRYGLSEVRFYYVPVSAREPQPASETVNVDPKTPLSWRAGREAASHRVSLSTDEQAVIGGTALVTTVAEPQYDAALDLNQSYFWKVVEVNDTMDPSAWEGDIWTFSTAEYLVVDDFESYTDDMDAGETIFQTWADGYQNDTNGSVVGHGIAPFAERTVVNGGRQSMPLAYDNAGGVYAETTRTFETAQDWTRHGIKTLVVNFQGQATNTAAPLYVKINNTKVLCNAGAAVTALPVWKQWNIDLAVTGASLKSVKSLTIGIGNGSASAAGTIFVDDIRLYRSAPEVVVPADPGNAGIVANYAMDGNLQDSSGKKNHGTAMADIMYDDAFLGHGQAAVFNGTNGYAELPIGSVINSLSDMTISLYANFSGAGGAWQRIFDFGSGTTSYMFFCPSGGGGATSPMRFAITNSGGGGESQLNGSTTLPTGWHHVAVVIDSATMTMRLYQDGALVASGATAVLPKDLGVTTQNWLGRSQYEGDAYYTGMLDDLRIYNRALSAAEVRYLAGDR